MIGKTFAKASAVTTLRGARVARIWLFRCVLFALASAAVVTPGHAAAPEIRTSARNKVPACVTPERLMRFLRSGNRRLLPKFNNIASYYKEHGERWNVRWDYAFFQMVIETNYLKFVNNAGKGDVSPRQNNFAGIGTTGGGVPGDSFPDVSTGVLGQIQHLVAYSGEEVPRPVAQRTRDKQDEILAKSRRLRHAPTFQDLSGRWAVDRRYGRSINFIADRYRAAYCRGREPDPEPEAVPGRSQILADAKADRGTSRQHRRQRAEFRSGSASMRSDVADAPGGTRAIASMGAPIHPAPQTQQRHASACAVFTASYGGRKNVLIRTIDDGVMRLTALQVLDGQEERLARSFIRSHAQGGEPIGQFPSRDAALEKAFSLCPSARSQG
ncbi:MAG: glucosaminidase domain-containing protein [Hyphomicrobiaceae bacterium]